MLSLQRSSSNWKSFSHDVFLFCLCARARGLDVAALSARAHVVYMGATRVKCSFICTCCLCTLRCEPIYALCLRLLTYVLLSELKCRIRGDQESTVVVAKKTTYSDVSNNHTGTAIYFQKIILPIRSYQRHVFQRLWNIFNLYAYSFLENLSSCTVIRDIRVLNSGKNLNMRLFFIYWFFRKILRVLTIPIQNAHLVLM